MKWYGWIGFTIKCWVWMLLLYLGVSFVRAPSGSVYLPAWVPFHLASLFPIGELCWWSAWR